VTKLTEFLAAFFPDKDEAIHFRAFKAKGAPNASDNHPLVETVTRRRLATDAELKTRMIAANEKRGWYFVVNTGGNTDTDIKRFNAFFVEIDDLPLDEQHRRFDASPLQPSILLETRKSVHAYWLIDGDCTEAEWRDIQARLIAYFGGDEKIKNPARVMRLPYFNHLHYNTQTLTHETKRVELVVFVPERRYTLMAMRAAFPESLPQTAPSPDATPNDNGSVAVFASWDELHAETVRRIRQSPKARTDVKGWTHAPGICHSSTEGKALYVSPDGAYGCHKGCTTVNVRAVYGLPERPDMAGPEATERDRVGETEVESEPPLAWPELGDRALYGLAGEIVRTIDPHTEADPAAVLIQTLAAFGNCIGRTAHFTAEADRHYLNLFAVLVGTTSKGRKGTSWGQVRALFERIDESWTANCVGAGLSSGEGLIWSVRDATEKKEPIKEKGRIKEYQMVIADEGVEDKRAFVLEAEFASVLRVMAREGNTLSAIIRQAWDTGNLQVKTRNNPNKATGAHVSIIGHITREELKRNLDETETANGFANRFLWGCVRRSRLLPEGGSISPAELNPIVSRLREALEFARNVREMKRDEEARSLWHQIYAELSSGHGGLLGAVTSRAEAQTMRLACLYALLDGTAMVGRVHLEAALALWRYCEASARYIFGNATGDRIADELFAALREAGGEGLTRTQIRDLFNRRRSGAIDAALAMLSETGRARFTAERTGGRPVTCWFAVRKCDQSDNSDNSIEPNDFEQAFVSNVAYVAGQGEEPDWVRERADEILERAAIMEFDGGIVREEAERLAGLDASYFESTAIGAV
jgi:hypothetical protein